jgi:hypothetical protein
MLCAFTVYKFWRITIATKIVTLLIIFFMTLSGIIDFFPIKNDQHMTISDYPKNSDILWIMNNTAKDSVFLNTSYLYDNASLSGRKIFMGWPYFSWGLGYDTHKRYPLMTDILSSTDKNYICTQLIKNNLSFVYLTNPYGDFKFDSGFWEKNFKYVYQNPNTKYTIFRTIDICLGK